MAGNYFQGAPVYPNALTFSGIQSANYIPNIGLVKPRTDGRPVVCIVTVGKQAPAFECSTLNIAQALSALAAAGSTESLPWLALTAMKWYGRKLDPNSPKFLGTSTHELVTATAGTMFFTGLEAQPNEPAVLSLMSIFTSSNGTTHPLAWTQVAAPTDPSTVAPYFLDTVTVDGTAVDEVLGVSISAGVDVQTEFGMLAYPRFARPRAVDWTINVRHNDKTLERVKTDKSAAIAVTLKNANNGAPTRGATVVTFTVTGTLTQGGSSHPGEGNSEVAHMVTGRHDGTNQPASWTVV